MASLLSVFSHKDDMAFVSVTHSKEGVASLPVSLL